MQSVFYSEISMKVFISWSGDRSKRIADTFSDWLPQIIQALDPWISSNIAKGARSTPEISSELEKSKIGIICLTPENVDSNWILFEAGALSKMSDTKVCTFLLDLTPSDIKPPLSQFQHTIFSKEDVFRLIETINKQLSISGEKSLPEKTLLQVFERSWSEFDNTVKEILKSNPQKAKQVRSERDILEEILALVRERNPPITTKEEGLSDGDFKLAEKAGKKYRRLVSEFGVKPSEAARSVLIELEKEGYLISPNLRSSIYNYFTTFKF
jgi:hypothetical protein